MLGAIVPHIFYSEEDFLHNIAYRGSYPQSGDPVELWHQAAAPLQEYSISSDHTSAHACSQQLQHYPTMSKIIESCHVRSVDGCVSQVHQRKDNLTINTKERERQRSGQKPARQRNSPCIINAKDGEQQVSGRKPSSPLADSPSDIYEQPSSLELSSGETSATSVIEPEFRRVRDATVDAWNETQSDLGFSNGSAYDRIGRAHSL